MKLSELLHETGIKCPEDMKNTADEIEITGIAFDSRKVKPGYLFVCLSGQHTDGHIYAADAVWKGAAAVLSQEDLGSRPFPVIQTASTRQALARIAKIYYRDPARDMRIFGVTGTNGKTTITYMLQRILETAGRSCGIIGTIGYHVGPRDYDSSRTTPESFEIWQLLAEMRKNGLTDCAMEVSSHGLALGRVEGLEFTNSIFTNLTVDHMDFHHHMEDYYQAKKKLFYMTRGAAVINVDDEQGERLYRELLADEKLRRCGTLWGCSMVNRRAEFFCEPEEMTGRGSRALLYREGELLGRLSIGLPGRFNLYNAMESAACAVLSGIGMEEISSALEDFAGAPGRFERVANQEGVTVIVDYAHTPDALDNVLKTARGVARGRLITVFGCGGDRDKSKRPIMGKIAGSYSDYTIITSDNPRTERQEDIARAIELGILETKGEYEILEGRRDAIARAISLYRPGDVILIAGKGHENYQIIGGSKNYFSDKETVEKILKHNGGQV